MTELWRPDGAAAAAEVDVQQPTSTVGRAGTSEAMEHEVAPRSGPDAAPRSEPDAAPRTGDDAIDADLAELTAAAHGPLDGVLETADRLHETLQRRLAEGGDA